MPTASPELMTRSVQQAKKPTALLGHWRLARWVHDERAGLSGTVDGELTLLDEDGVIAWHEQGTLLWNGSRMPVSRSYLLRPVEGQWRVCFPDGRLFHPWSPGQWVHHPCSEDDYRGLITISGPDAWDTLWEVRGPATTQRISTHLTRIGPP